MQIKNKLLSLHDHAIVTIVMFFCSSVPVACHKKAQYACYQKETLQSS
jgi:hypothetical protein